MFTCMCRPFLINDCRSGVNGSVYCAGDSLASYNFADSNKFKTIVVFDCRGVEPVEFSPRNGWKVGIFYSTIPRVKNFLNFVILYWRLVKQLFLNDTGTGISFIKFVANFTVK